MHECVGASQGYHGVYRAAQTVLSRCCHGYSGIPTPVGQIPYYPTAKNPPTTQPLTLTLTHQPLHDSHRQEPTNPPTTLTLTLTLTLGTAISPTGGVFSYLPHHLDLASEDSVGHSTCMSVLARRRAIMGSIVQPKRSCLGAATGTAESPHRWGKYHTYPTAKNPPTTQPLTLTLTLTLNTAISPTGGVFSYLPQHLDLASEDSVGHSTCMSVLARRRAIMGSIVQPKRSCLGAATGTAESSHRWGKYHTYPNAKNPPTTQPLTLTLTLGTAFSPTRGVFSYLPHHLDLASEDSVGHSTCMSVLARRGAIVGFIVQPKRSCLGAVRGTAESPHRWGKYHTYPTAKNPPTTQPLTLTLTLGTAISHPPVGYSLIYPTT